MRRIAFAAMLAGLLSAGNAVAGPNDGPWGHAIRLFPHIHQHGPLYNYGPYYDYPPFEPYGDWNSYLQYTGPNPIPQGTGAGSYGWIHGPNPQTFGGGFPHHLNLGNRGGLIHGRTSSGCSSCGAAAEQFVNSGNAIDRYSGIGTPAASQAYYADGPVLITVGFPGR